MKANTTAPTGSEARVRYPALQGTRILVVEDDDIIRGLHEAVLSYEGCATEGVGDGAEGLEVLAEREFDLVLTDCRMPTLDGFNMIRAIRNAGLKVPVMVVSGSLSSGDLPEDLREEIAVALPKPVRTRDLLAGAVEALQSRWDQYREAWETEGRGGKSIC